MANKASVVIQDLTYTEKEYGLGVTISYVNAAALSVSVASKAITVAITASTTAAQIKAAVEAKEDANRLVAVTVSGTGSNIQKTCKNATLVGGADAAKASAIIGPLVLTADTAGVAGNSITLKFTPGATAGAEVVTVSTNDIEVQIEDGVSTAAQVKAALDADMSAAALVDVTYASVAPSSLVFVASAPSPINLAGGVDATAASVVNQDLTIASVATDPSANGKTFSYTTGATAGAEVVTVDGSDNVSVQIENGVSTATQIETALNLESAFTTLYTVTVSGTGSNAQKTVNAAATSGAVGVGADAYYADGTSVALTASYVNQWFGFHGNILVLANDETTGSKTVWYSYDGINDHGKLGPGQSIVLDVAQSVVSLFLKETGGAPAYRLMVK